MSRAAANRFALLVDSCAAERSVFNVALSGGETPKRLFALLAAEPYASQINWELIHFFWGDERSVPPDDPLSNFGSAYSLLLSKVPVPPANIHRIQAELGPQEAAAGYESELRHRFRLMPGQLPRFDLVVLGLGGDGHTASLFAGTEALEETERLVVTPWIERFEAHRISLTCPVLNNAAFIMFLVSGDDKAEILKAVLECPAGQYPAQLVQPGDGELHWYIDRAAGRLLTDG
jgi:6-phosphogluconolactonase